MSKRVLIDKQSRASPQNDCTGMAIWDFGQTLKDRVNAMPQKYYWLLILVWYSISFPSRLAKVALGRRYILGVKYCDRIPVGTSASSVSKSLHVWFKVTRFPFNSGAPRATLTNSLYHFCTLFLHRRYINYSHHKQAWFYLKMAETKRPVGLLFDIGGVCVSELLEPSIKSHDTDQTIGCLSFPSHSRLWNCPEHSSRMGQFQYLANVTER